MWQHLVEEYARHNGHADLLREAIDGSRRAIVMQEEMYHASRWVLDGGMLCYPGIVVVAVPPGSAS